MSDNEDFTEAQKRYLEGLASGLNVARPPAGGSGAPAGPDALMLEGQAGTERQGGKLVAEEKMKRERHPLDRWDELTARAADGTFPKGTDVFATKYHGLFYVAPAQESYMCRLRLPNGILTGYQLRGVADLARRYGGAYAHVTTRANLQLREIGAGDPVNVLNGLLKLGIVTRGAGADNVRNITGSPLAGIDPDELVDTRPFAEAIHLHILNTRALYGLPRKFNISVDGGGRPAVLEETNDIGFSAVEVVDGPIEPGVYFRLALGGITGHGDFTRATGRLVRPDDVVAVAHAILEVFIEHGNRADRKKARLKYLLDAWGLERFIGEVESRLADTLVPAEGVTLAPRTPIDRYAHVGVHAQRQAHLNWIGVAVPVGRLTDTQMEVLADLADRYGSGTVRLTVWQNLIVSDVRDEDVETVTTALEAAGLATCASAIRSNLVACTGNTGCKFAASNTKRHALEIADHLESRIALDSPVNIHLTGCHHSCAQHFIGDIGLIACKVETETEDVEGYDVLVGGGYATDPKIAREFALGVTAQEVPYVLESLLKAYLSERKDASESFTDFVTRADLTALKTDAVTRARQAA